MPTVRVDNLHTFKNEFSRFGRRTNELYKQLNKKGCHYILERDMPDKSRVILAYESKDSKTSKYTIGLRRDGSMIQKTYERSEVIQPLTIIDRIQTITKTFLESTGEKVKEITKIISYDIENKILNKQIFKHTKRDVSHYEYDRYGGRHAQCNRIIDNVRESFSNVATDGSENQILYVQYMDGTKVYKRFIDEVYYCFTTKK